MDILKCVLVMSAVLLTACAQPKSSLEPLKTSQKASQKNVRQSAYQPTEHARIRIYRDYQGTNMKQYAGLSCQEWAAKQGKRRLKLIHVGFPKKARNISIGMTPTVKSEIADKSTGIEGRKFYREVIVKAESLLLFDSSQQVFEIGDGTICRTAASFTPEAGKEYELMLNMEKAGCAIEINEVLPTSKLKPADVTYCPKPNTAF